MREKEAETNKDIKDNEYEDWSPMDDALFQYFASKYWDFGPLGRHRGLNCTKPPDTTDWRPYCGDFFNDDDPAVPHETLSWTREYDVNDIDPQSSDSSQLEQTLQPNAALLPSHVAAHRCGAEGGGYGNGHVLPQVPLLLSGVHTWR